MTQGPLIVIDLLFVDDSLRTTASYLPSPAKVDLQPPSSPHHSRCSALAVVPSYPTLDGLRAVRRDNATDVEGVGGGVMLLLTAKRGCRPADRRSR